MVMRASWSSRWQDQEAVESRTAGPDTSTRIGASHRVEVAGIRGQGLALCDQGRLLVGLRVDQDLKEEEGIARNTKESDFFPEIRMATTARVTCKASLLGYDG